MTYDEPIRLKGWVMSSNLIDPQEDFFQEDLIYKVSLQPADPGIFMELEKLVEEAKESNTNPFNKDVTYNHKDRVTDHCNVLFETKFQPQLVGELREADHDSQLFGKYVQVVGAVQHMTNGNVFLSCHIVEPCEVDDFDPMED